jgi:hypothetical protein
MAEHKGPAAIGLGATGCSPVTATPIYNLSTAVRTSYLAQTVEKFWIPYQNLSCMCGIEMGHDSARTNSSGLQAVRGISSVDWEYCTGQSVLECDAFPVRYASPADSCALRMCCHCRLQQWAVACGNNTRTRKYSSWPATWSSSQRFWLLIMRSRVRVPVLPRRFFPG